LKRDEPALSNWPATRAATVVFQQRTVGRLPARLSHHSQIAFERTGCYGIAESAALALAEQLTQAPAKLLIPAEIRPGHLRIGRLT
jgi:cobalt-precorrin 5A hydrolase